MNDKSTDVASATRDSALPGPIVVATTVGRAYASAKESTGYVARVAMDMGQFAGKKLAGALDSTREVIVETAVLLGDLNNDGKVDHEDAKIAAIRVKALASQAACEAGALAKELAKYDMVKNAAAGAVIGVVVAIPIPFVGPAVGAAFGAIAGVVNGIVSPSQKS